MALIVLLSIALICVFPAQTQQVTNNTRSFIIGYNENCFLKDGECFRYVSGSMHYFRVPREYWQDRFLKFKAAGLNVVQTYIEWSSHEPEPGVYDFSANLDVVEYIKAAADAGLLVIVRPGPYIDSERDMGGLPYWLLRMNKTMVLRSNDQSYMFYVERYFSKLLPLLKPLMYHNGGPIISVQVENEYGSYFACDRDYTSRLRYVMESALGMETLFFTTDGYTEGFLKCGPVDGAYPTVDFGSGTDPAEGFTPVRVKEPAGPLVNSEFYPGWIDHWSHPHSLVDPLAVALSLDKMLAMNASVNIYIFHGGTSFGLTSGANIDGDNYDPNPTSYDFDAPISESGDLTRKYMMLRDVIKKYVPTTTDAPLPHNSTKISFGPVHLTFVYAIVSYLPAVPQNQSTYPLTFEELSINQGFVFYETTVPFQTTDPVLLSVPGLKDRGYVFVDRILKGVISRQEKIYTIPVLIRPGQNLSIFVENQGRVCYGTDINDFKGILGNVTLGDKVLQDWTMYLFPIPAPIPNNSWMLSRPSTPEGVKEGTELQVPGLFTSVFMLDKDMAPADTFLRLDGWNKGVAILNGIVLGRYWPVVGPQATLYVPGVYLKPNPEYNSIILLELEGAPCTGDGKGCNVSFVDTPDINSPTPNTQLSYKLNMVRRL